jgi:hypothetical protein
MLEVLVELSVNSYTYLTIGLTGLQSALAQDWIENKLVPGYTSRYEIEIILFC